MRHLLWLLLAAAPLYAQVPQPVRDTPYDWRCVDEVGSLVSEHQRQDTAMYACQVAAAENPGTTYYIEPGRYRVLVESSEPDPQPEPEPEPTASLSANPDTIEAGEETTIVWDSNADACTLNAAGQSQQMAGSGSVATRLSETTTINLDCDGALASVTVTVASSPAPAPDPAPEPGVSWEIVRNFNAGSEGSTAYGSDAFDDAADESFYDDAQFSEGGQSAELNVRAGSTAFGDWGGIINFPANVAGGELWLKMDYRFPSGFSFNTNSGSIKFLRFHDGSRNNYLDIQIDDGDHLRINREGTSIGWTDVPDSRVVLDKWHEIVVRLDGGLAIWIDRDLKLDTTRVETYRGGFFDALYLFTYWNGGAPRSQHHWVDDVRIAAGGTPSWAP